MNSSSHHTDWNVTVTGRAAMNCIHARSWAQQGDEQSERDISETPGKHTLLIAVSASFGSDTWCPAEMLMTFLIFHWHSRSSFRADCFMFFFLLLVWNKYLLHLLRTCQSCGSACLALRLPGREPPDCCSNLVISWFLCLWTGKYLIFPSPHLRLSIFWGHSPSLTSQWREMPAGQLEADEHYVNDEVRRRYLWQRA